MSLGAGTGLARLLVPAVWLAAAVSPPREICCSICGRYGGPNLVSPETRRCLRPCFGRVKMGGRGGRHTAAEGRRRIKAQERYLANG